MCHGDVSMVTTPTWCDYVWCGCEMMKTGCIPQKKHLLGKMMMNQHIFGSSNLRSQIPFLFAQQFPSCRLFWSNIAGNTIPKKLVNISFQQRPAPQFGTMKYIIPLHRGMPNNEPQQGDCVSWWIATPGKAMVYLMASQICSYIFLFI